MGFLFSKPRPVVAASMSKPMNTRTLRYGRTTVKQPKVVSTVTSASPLTPPLATVAEEAEEPSSKIQYPTMDSYTRRPNFADIRPPMPVWSVRPEQVDAEIARATDAKRTIVQRLLSLDVSPITEIPLGRIGKNLSYNSAQNLRDSLTKALTDYTTLKKLYPEETEHLEQSLVVARTRRDAAAAVSQYQGLLLARVTPIFRSMTVSPDTTYERILEFKQLWTNTYGAGVPFPIPQDKLAEWAASPAPVGLSCDAPEEANTYMCRRAAETQATLRAAIERQEGIASLNGLLQKVNRIGAAIGLKEADVVEARRRLAAFDDYIEALSNLSQYGGVRHRKTRRRCMQRKRRATRNRRTR